MALTEKDVDHVAKLARLEITPEERARYGKQLNAILEHADDLAGLDLKGVEPTIGFLSGALQAYRTDAIKDSLPREEVLANAPDKAKGCFRVPKILE